MSMDDELGQMFDDVFEDQGVDGLVSRGATPQVPVRIVVRRGVNKYGEMGQVVGQVTTVSFLLSQWDPKQGDQIAWTDRFGAQVGRISSEMQKNGYRAEVVLHG